MVPRINPGVDSRVKIREQADEEAQQVKLTHYRTGGRRAEATAQGLPVRRNECWPRLEAAARAEAAVRSQRSDMKPLPGCGLSAWLHRELRPRPSAAGHMQRCSCRLPPRQWKRSSDRSCRGPKAWL